MGWFGPGGSCGCCEECFCLFNEPYRLKVTVSNMPATHTATFSDGGQQNVYCPGSDPAVLSVSGDLEITGLDSLNGTYIWDHTSSSCRDGFYYPLGETLIEAGQLNAILYSSEDDEFCMDYSDTIYYKPTFFANSTSITFSLELESGNIGSQIELIWRFGGATGTVGESGNLLLPISDTLTVLDSQDCADLSGSGYIAGGGQGVVSSPQQTFSPSLSFDFAVVVEAIP